MERERELSWQINAFASLDKYDNTEYNPVFVFPTTSRNTNNNTISTLSIVCHLSVSSPVSSEPLIYFQNFPVLIPFLIDNIYLLIRYEYFSFIYDYIDCFELSIVWFHFYFKFNFFFLFISKAGIIILEIGTWSIEPQPVG